MATATTNPMEELEQLKERVRNGDASVTPVMLAKAQQLAELAVLQKEADDRAAARAEQERVEAERQAVRDEVGGRVRPTLEAGQAAYAATVEALRHLHQAMAAYNATYDAAMAAYRRVGITGELDEFTPVRPDFVHDAAINEARDDPRRSSFRDRRPVRHPMHSDEAYELLCRQVHERDQGVQQLAEDRERERQAELARQAAEEEQRRRASEEAERERHSQDQARRMVRL